MRVATEAGAGPVASLTVSVDLGSRYESAENNGVCSVIGASAFHVGEVVSVACWRTMQLHAIVLALQLLIVYHESVVKEGCAACWPERRGRGVKRFWSTSDPSIPVMKRVCALRR